MVALAARDLVVPFDNPIGGAGNPPETDLLSRNQIAGPMFGIVLSVSCLKRGHVRSVSSARDTGILATRHQIESKKRRDFPLRIFHPRNRAFPCESMWFRLPSKERCPL